MISAAIVADDSIVNGPSALEQFEKGQRERQAKFEANVLIIEYIHTTFSNDPEKRDVYLRKFRDDPERFRNEAEKVW